MISISNRLNKDNVPSAAQRTQRPRHWFCSPLKHFGSTGPFPPVAVNQGKFHPSLGLEIRAATIGELWLPKVREAEKLTCTSSLGSALCSGQGLWWAPFGAGSAAADLLLWGKWLWISTCKADSRALFCPDKANFASGSLCLLGSWQHLRGRGWGPRPTFFDISGSLQFFCALKMDPWSGRTGSGFTSFIFPETVSKLIYMRCAPWQMPSPSYCFS